MQLHRTTLALLLLLLAFAPLGAQRDQPPYTLTEDGGLRISNGYALVLTAGGQGIVYDPTHHILIMEWEGEVRLLTGEEWTQLLREIKRIRCGCARGEVCVNGRCWRGISEVGVARAWCRPPCESGYVCINGKCLERPFDPCADGGKSLRLNGQCVTDARGLPLRKLWAAARPLKQRPKGVYLFELP